jgi:hypothetical protein
MKLAVAWISCACHAMLLQLTCCLSCHCVPAAEADGLRVQWGKNELEEKSKPKWLVFVELVRACLTWLLLVLNLPSSIAVAPHQQDEQHWHSSIKAPSTM